MSRWSYSAPWQLKKQVQEPFYPAVQICTCLSNRAKVGSTRLKKDVVEGGRMKKRMKGAIGGSVESLSKETTGWVGRREGAYNMV